MKLFAIYGFVVLCLLATLFHPRTIDSANLTSVKDTLQTSRLSANARVDYTGTAVGGSNVRLKTSSSSPSYTITTNNINQGDSLTIGTHSYTVIGINDSSNFTVTPVIASGDDTDNGPIYLKIRPQHVVTFHTATAVPDGFFQVLLPSDPSTGNDGKPDPDGYDFNTTVDVAATNVTGYTFVTGVATPSAGTGCTSPSNYHCFEVHYSGSGAIGTTITITIGNTSGTNTPIAPATGTSHTEGTADTYPVLVKNFSAGSNPNSASPVDKTTAEVAHIESVRVTATVLPTISLTITGVAAGQTRCGVTTDVTTTALAVPFGTMSLNTFKNAAHLLTVNTNASGGYALTASENQPLGKDGNLTPNIPDTLGNNTTESESVSDEWTTPTVNGFGFSLQNVNASTVPFQYTTATGTCTGTFCSRQFANINGSETPQTISSSTTVANAEAVDVCYRLGVGATQAAGDYENQITYTATGTF